jgi:hypothetical protein
MPQFRRFFQSIFCTKDGLIEWMNLGHDNFSYLLINKQAYFLFYVRSPPFLQFNKLFGVSVKKGNLSSEINTQIL